MFNLSQFVKKKPLTFESCKKYNVEVKGALDERKKMGIEGDYNIDIDEKMNYANTGKRKKVYLEKEVEYISCPLCGSKSYDKLCREKGILGIVKCSDCNLIYVNPGVKQPHKAYWCDVDKYWREAKLIFEGKARHHRDPSYIHNLKIIQKHKPRGNFLDIGSGMGFFLRLARNRGWNLKGVEPSPSLSELARKHFGLDIKTAFLEDAGFSDDYFDVVTMIDVFEHINDPCLILNQIRRILKPDGILFIKVPNGRFNLFKLYVARLMGRQEDYDIFDAHEHVVHYTHETIVKMLNKCGLKAIKLHTGKPLQTPVWHKYLGYYYQYPMPWCLDPMNHLARSIFYLLSLIEIKLFANRKSWLAPSIIAIAAKK